MFDLITDSASNIFENRMIRDNIKTVTLSYSENGEQHDCYTPNKPFDFKGFYALLRSKAEVKTSMANAAEFERMFSLSLKQGNDVLYIGLSSVLSGTFNAAKTAAELLGEDYSDRKIICIDSLSGSLGEGLLVQYAAMMRRRGKGIDDVARRISALVPLLRSRFTCDDLFYLKRGGRISGATALIGTALGIKPLLCADSTGKVVMYDKVRGRRAAIDRLVDELEQSVDKDKHQIAAVSHADCKDDADYLVGRIKKLPYISDVIVEMMEPVTGTHGGPGMLALFYIGERV